MHRFRHVVPMALVALSALLIGALWSPAMAAALPDSASAGKGTSPTSGTRSTNSTKSTTKSTTKKSASTGAAAGKRTHIVGRGDTVARIAKRYGVSADAIRAANGIVDDKLFVSSRLIIDGSAAGPTASTGSRVSKVSKAGTYTIKDGDTLSGIASRQGVSLSALLSANGLRSTSLILPGDTLTVPSSSGGVSSSSATSSVKGRSSGSVGPDLRCPVPSASFMNDWGFPRDGGGRFHEGSDLFARKGTPIVAPASGSVVFGKGGRGGNTFTLTTASGWEIYGAHMNTTVGSSRVVKAGELIGTVGNTGNAAGGDTHLHMGVKRVGGPAMNPYPSVKAACG